MTITESLRQRLIQALGRLPYNEVGGLISELNYLNSGQGSNIFGGVTIGGGALPQTGPNVIQGGTTSTIMGQGVTQGSAYDVRVLRVAADSLLTPGFLYGEGQWQIYDTSSGHYSLISDKHSSNVAEARLNAGHIHDPLNKGTNNG